MTAPSRRAFCNNEPLASSTYATFLCFRMNDPIYLLHCGSLHPRERNAINIAKWMGRPMQPLQLNTEAREHERYLRRSVREPGCLVTSAETIAEICRAQLDLEFLQILKNVAADIFVFGFNPVPEHIKILQELTAGNLSGVEALRPGDSRFNVEENSRDICNQFAGLSFDAQNSQFAFIEGPGYDRFSPLIRIGKRPLFGCANDGASRVFLSACGEIADPEMAVLEKLRGFASSPLSFRL